MGFPGGSAGKESACSAGDWVPSLGREDPLEKEKATHSSILAWRIPWTVHGVSKSWTRLRDFHSLTVMYFNFFLYFRTLMRNYFIVIII